MVLIFLRGAVIVQQAVGGGNSKLLEQEQKHVALMGDSTKSRNEELQGERLHCIRKILGVIRRLSERITQRVVFSSSILSPLSVFDISLNSASQTFSLFVPNEGAVSRPKKEHICPDAGKR